MKKSKRIGWLIIDPDTPEKDVKALQRAINDFREVRKILVERDIEINTDELSQIMHNIRRILSKK